MADNNLNLESILPDDSLDNNIVPTDNTDQGIDPPVKKQEASNSGASFAIFGNKPVEGKPVPTKNPILDNIGQFIPNRVVGGAERNLGIDLDEYASYFSNNTGFVPNKEALDSARAQKQSTIAQFGNAIARVGLNILPEVIGQAANVLDFEDYFNTDKEIGNWVSNLTKQVQENTNEEFPIYRENPNTPLDLGDPAYWFENGANLVTSAGAFVGLGIATGGATLTALTKGAKALQWLKGGAQAAELAASTTSALRGSSTILSSLMLNQAESVGIGVNVYDQAYNNKLTELQGDPEFADRTIPELQAIAQETAAGKASEAVNFNRMNILLNLTGASLLMKTPLSSTRQILNAPSIKKTAATIGLEGAQEGLEENINDISEQRALADSYNLQDGLNRVFSEEGLESGLLGFIGGAGQVALGKVGKRLPIYDNQSYRKDYISRLEQLKSDTNLSEEQKDVEAKKYALDRNGISANRISDNQRQTQAYNKQQWQLSNQNNLSNVDKLTDSIAALNSAQESIDLYQEIVKAKEEGNIVKAENLSNRLLSHQAFNAFETGTTDNLENIYKGIEGLSHEEAEAKGIYKEGDEGTPDYYKTKMKTALDNILSLEKEYNNSLKYINQSEVYNIKSNQIEINNAIKNLDTKISNNMAEARNFFNETDTLLVDTITGDNITDINIINSPVSKTDYYNELKELYKARKEYTDINERLQQVYNNITSKEYQRVLTENIKKVQESNRKAENKKSFLSRVLQTKKETNTLVNTLEQSAVNTTEEVSEIDTTETTESNDTSSSSSPNINTTTEVVEENTIPNEITSTKQVADITTVIPTSTGNGDIDKQLNQFNTTFSNPDISLEDKNKNADLIISNYSNPILANVINPLKIQEILAAAKNIKEQINNQLNQVSENNAILANQQEELITDLEEDNSPDTEDENNLPAETSESLDPTDILTKARRRINTMINILESIRNSGIDLNDFKAVVNSFELNVGKERIQSVYTLLRNIYNSATNQDIQDTYEELMYDSATKAKIVKESKDIMTFSLEDELYTSDHDNITKANLNNLNTIANLNNLDARDSGFEFDSLGYRGEIGSNKLAYLARKYSTVFVPRVTENGNTYIAVTKGDIDNLLNSNLSDKVLDGTLKAGTQITIAPLDSVELEDGTVIDSATAGIENTPIGIFLDGELLDGLYLHDTNWINFTNLNNTKDNIISDQEKLNAIRKYILDRGSILTKIDRVGPGVPILDVSGEYNTISNNMPDVQVGIIKNGRVQLDENNSVKVVNDLLPREGSNVVIITLGDGTKSALQVSRTRLEPSYKDSIIRALDSYITQEKTEATKTIANLYGIDILTAKGIESYMTKFLYGYNKPIKTYEEFNDFLNNVKDNVYITQFRGSEIRYGAGQGVNSGVIKPQKGITEEDKKSILDSFRYHLDNLYTNVDILQKTTNFTLPIINEDGSVTNDYTSYTDFIKDNLLTNHLSIKLTNGKTIYTVQSSIEYNTGFMANEPVVNATDKANIVKQESSSINIGEEDFSDITEEFDSPNTVTEEELNSNLLSSSTLIPKVSIANQTNLIKGIVSELYQDLITNSNYDQEYQLNIESAVNLKLEGLRVVKEKYIAANHPQAKNISEQIDSINENKAKVIQAVERRINKFANISNITSIDNSNDEKNENEENDFEGEDVLGERNIYLDTALYAINPQTQLRIEVQKLLSDIVDYKVDFVEGQAVFKERKNQFFDNVYVGEDEVYKTIMSILATSNSSYIKPSFDNYITALNARVLEKPFLYDVIEKLKYEPEHIKNAFVTGFSKHATAHIFLQQGYNKVTKEYSLKPIASNSRNLPDLVIGEWQNKMRTSGVLKPDGRNLVFNSNAINHFNSRFEGIANKSITLDYENVNAMLSAVGIELPSMLYQKFANEGIQRKNSDLSLYSSFIQSGGIFKIIHARLNRLANTTIDLEGQKEIDLDSINLFSDQAFKDLASYIARYRTDLFSNSHKDGKGNNIYSYSNNKYIVDRFGELKTDNQLINNYLIDPFAKSSSWLNNMINVDEYGVAELNRESLAYRYLGYNTLDSFKFGNDRTRMVDGLNEAEFEKMRLAYFYNQGTKANKNTPVYRFLFPTMSDKSTVFMLQSIGKNYELVNNQISDADLEQLTEQLVYPEVNRIKQFEANPDKVNIKEYKQGAGMFMLYPILNDIEELWITDNDGNKALNPNVGVTQDMKNILKQQLRNYINSEISNKYNKWLDYGIITTDKKTGDIALTYVDKNYREAYGNPGINSILRNYVINNMIAEMNMQQLFIGDPALYTKGGKDNFTIAYNTNDNQLKRLAADNAGKTDIIGDKEERFNLLVVKDKELGNQSVGIDYLRSLGNDIAEDYLKINGTDAQEYTTLEEHLRVMFKQGEISKEDMDDIMYKYNTDRPLNLKDMKIIISANKPVYANNYMRDGIMSRLYVKSSSIPLIKQFTVNSPLDKLRSFMENTTDENGNKIAIDRIAFESAVKVGLPSQVVSIFNNGEVVIPDNWQSSLLEVPRYGHGIQNKVPYEPKKDKINYGSQRAKLLFNNLHDIAGFIDPISGKEVNGRELNNGYKETWRKLYKTKYKSLINELEFNKDNGTINVSKLQRILIREAVTRNYNINDLAGLELNETGDDFKVPLYLNNNESKINSLLNSIVDNRIRKIKVKGKSFVLVSEEGHNKTQVKSLDQINPQEMVLSKDWNGELNTTIEKDGKISYAEVLVPFKFWDNKGELLSIKDYMTSDGYIDMTKISPELLELYGFRIPTQGLSSMSMIKIVGFIPEGFGDMIVASRDFVQQMGSDFDVDKLYTQMYNTFVNYKGAISPIINKNKELYNGIANIDEKILENEILDYTKAVFNNPNKEVQRQRAKALSFGNLKSIASKLFVNPINRYWTPLSEDFQSYRYMSARAGKALVGAFSLDSVFNASLQEITQPVNFMVKDENEEGKMKPLRIGIAGIWSNNLNQSKTADGLRYKSDTISAFQSAALDDAKEQLLYKLNINNSTADAIRAMAQMGFDEEMISRVINQPAVKNYVRDINLGKADALDIEFTLEKQLLVARTPINEMESYITDNISSGDYQDAILNAYLEFSKRGKQLKAVQSVINSDSAGIGKNMFYTLAKVDKIIGLGRQSNISNIEKVIGDYLYFEQLQEYKDLETEEERKEWLQAVQDDEGYYLYNKVLIRPTTINGFASVYATLFNAEVWNNYFPYNYTGIKDTIDLVVSNQIDSPISINQKAEEMQRVYNDYKSYLASSAFILGDYNSITEARRDLLIDDANHMSLGSIIADIKSKNKLVNPFIDRLKIGDSNKPIDTSGKIPTEITMINASSQEMEEEVIINSIIQLLTNSVNLGVYNGKEYTTKDLMQNLINYSLVTKGIQTTNEFIKYIPVSYLQDIGYFAEVERQIFNRNETEGNSAFKFYTQYIQHNPGKYYNPKFDEFVDKVQNGRLILKNIELIEVFPSHVSQVYPNNKGYKVYKFNPDDNGYYEIDTLGNDVINEFNTNAQYAGSSLIYINQADRNSLVEQGIVEDTQYVPITTNEYIPLPSETDTFLKLNRDTTEDNSPLVMIHNEPTLSERYSLNDNVSSVEEKYRQILETIVNNPINPIQSYFANKLLDITGYLANTPIYEDKTLTSKGRTFTTKVAGEPVQIRINTNKINSEEELQNILLEEIIHATLKNELTKDNNNTRILNKLYNEVKQETIIKYGQYSFDEVERKMKDKSPLRLGTERDIIYNLSSIDEFVAAAVTNKKFQDFLNSTKNKDKSLWAKLVEAVRGILVSLGVVQDTQLEAVLGNILSSINTIDQSLRDKVTPARYVRTQGYLNTKFNLIDADGNSIIKPNAGEIVDFINKNISNVYANNIEGKVILGYNIYNNLDLTNSPDIEEAKGGNFKTYIDTINFRLEKLKNNLNKARQDENFSKVAVLENDVQEERDKLEKVKEITNLVDLGFEGQQELIKVSEILKRDMSAEDILYVRSTVNFWRNAKEFIFDEFQLESDTLGKQYGDLERQAYTQHLKLVKIEKKYLEDYVKNKTGKDISIQDLFDNYRDINQIESLTLDISEYDNTLLSSIFIDVKEANLRAEEEANEIANRLDEKVEKALPALKAINNKNPWDIFRQRTGKGNLTGHLISNFSNMFYKERGNRLNSLNNESNFANYESYVNWLAENTIDIKLEEYFSENGLEITEEMKAKREELKKDLGEYTYNTFITNQEKKIEQYRNAKEGVINSLMDRFGLAEAKDINDNQDASNIYTKWVIKSSPFKMSLYINEGLPSYLQTYKNFNSQRYYEVVPVARNSKGFLTGYYDSKFSTIENNPEILDFYNEVTNIMKELKSYIPQEQQKTLAYNGLPEIEKSLIELYSERGLKVGYKPILESLQQSLQSNYSDYAIGTPDPITQQPQKNMRVGMINNNYQEIKSYIALKTAQYIADNKKSPSLNEVNTWEEEKINELAENKSFDLGKVLKVFSVGVLGYKHKSRIEDKLKLATNIIDTMQEAERRGDGTPLVLADTGRVYRKNADESFTNVKSALEHFINLNLYNDRKEEEGKGKLLLTTKEKEIKKEIDTLIKNYETELEYLESNKEAIGEQEFLRRYSLAQEQLVILKNDSKDLGTNRVYSKYGDSVLQYFQLLGMGWNVLGGIANMGFGFVSNAIEGAGNELYSNTDLMQAYKLVSASILKNATFNKVEIGESKKIRALMDKWNVLKDSSQELFKTTISDSIKTNIEWLKPMNANQRTEYINQAPLMIAMAKNVKIDTPTGQINLYEGYDENGKWKQEYGNEPTEQILKYRLRLDQAIAKRIHGNYDPTSSPKLKRYIAGRAIIQFRSWLINAITVRFGKERYDDVLDLNVKGRYRSVWDTKKENIPAVGLQMLKSIVRQGSFNTIFKDADFNTLSKDGKISETDAANLRRVSMEVLLAINVNLALLALTAALKGGDDEENYVYNTLFNQGLRLRTDLLLYVNPAEGRKLFKDIIPAITLIDNTKNWLISGGNLMIGEDEYETGEYAGDSKFARNTAKIIPFATQGYRMYSSSVQEFD